ncbi:MAG: flagellar basal-body MS-ring/collar protein FliF [Opitutales bacterium]
MSGITSQLTQFWTELSTPQRMSIVLAIAGVFIGMGALMYWSSRPSMQLLYGGLEPEEMAEVVQELEAQGVPHELRSNGHGVWVPSADVHSLRMSLAAKGLPATGGVGFEIFDEGNFGYSEKHQQINYIRAIQGELSRTISQLSGVRDARVMVVMPENRLLLDSAKNRATASVFVDTGGRVLDESSINAVRFLVANAVEGLELNEVAVVDSRGNVLSERVRSDESYSLAGGHLRMQQKHESYLQDKIEQLLLPVVGQGNVVARVSVDLETEATTMVEEIYDPEGQVVARQTKTEEGTDSTESSGGNTAAGITANLPEEQAEGGAGSMNRTSDTRKNTETEYLVNRQTRETRKSPGDIRNVTAAVFVAARTQLNAETGEVEAAPRTPEEIQSIQEMVSKALGLAVPQGTNVKPQVTVSEMPFIVPETEDGLWAMINGPLYRWMETGKSFLAVGVAVLLFMIFVRMLRRHRFDQFGVEIVEDREPIVQPGERRQRMMAKPTPQLLNDLISQKPDNVSIALKNWMTSNSSR